jgi:uncharacterized membrane protein YkoI
MKTSLRLLLAVALVGATAVGFAAGKNDEKKEAPSAVGSIRPKGEVKPQDLPALAKISFETALAAALKASPGAVIKAELEVEDGNLQYSFEIVGADKAVTEVEIDAGNGKVLGIDKS